MRQLGELTELVGGRLALQPTLEINGAASISRAGPSDITFATTPQHLESFLGSDAAAAVVPMSLDTTEKPCIQVENVELAFREIAELFRPPVERPRIGISPQAIISPTAQISDDVCIYPGAVVMDNVEIGCGTVIYPNVTIMENCVVGAHVKIFPNCVLYEDTIVGDRSTLHAGVILGAFGFGYKPEAGRHRLCAQLGNVVVGDDVEIGANTTVDRGTFDSTLIGSGSKIDNLVMVGHNCVIGEHNLLCSQVGIAGSCTTGQYVVMGGQVGLADHLNIGDNVALGAKSGLMHDVPANQKFFGIPARPAREEMQLLASKTKLPEMRKELKRLAKQIDALKQNNSNNQDSEDSRAA